MELPTIYNCHIHTFTASHVPDHFPPPWVRGLIYFKPFRMFLIFIAHQFSNLFALIRILIPELKLPTTLLSYSSLIRFERFYETGARKTQEGIFNRISLQYPEKTRFIILPMDMEYMGSGKPSATYRQQLEELALLRDKYPEAIIPYFAADPRRPGLLELFNEFINTRGFKGVKIYPNLGYYPDDPRLMEIYAICEKKKIPILAHCSPGGVGLHKASKEQIQAFGHPANYRKVLRAFPKLNFCLAHFGGAEEWERHLTGTAPREGEDASWLSVISNMIRKEKFTNLFTDVSYTLFCETPSYRPFTYYDFLKVMLTDETLKKQVLFGSDYYMVEQEKISEKEVSIALRSRLGEELYFQIAHENPKRYLYETADKKPKREKARSVKKGSKN